MLRAVVLILMALLVGPAGAGAQAQDEAVCEGWAAQQALPLLTQSYSMTANSTQPTGWGPFIGPLTGGPPGGAALFGPPGLVAAFGPLGPGPTANALSTIVLRQGAPAGAGGGGPLAAAAGGAPAATAGGGGPLAAAVAAIPIGPILPPSRLASRPQLPPGGEALIGPPGGDFGTRLQLVSLRQAELGNLLNRYANSSSYQQAVGFWAGAYASAAKETYEQALADCNDYMKAARESQAGSAPAGSAPAAAPADGR